MNLGTVLLREEVDLDENLLKESFADLDTKFFFLETLPDYLQKNNKNFYILYLNIRSLQKKYR